MSKRPADAAYGYDNRNGKGMRLDDGKGVVKKAGELNVLPYMCGSDRRPQPSSGIAPLPALVARSVDAVTRRGAGVSCSRPAPRSP